MFSPAPSQLRPSVSRHGSPFVHSAQPLARSASVASAAFTAPRTRSTSYNPMHVDDSLENTVKPIYAKLNEYKATFYGYPPSELETLRASDFNREEFFGSIDRVTSHTLLISPTVAYAWKHIATHPSTCYIFPCPPRSTDSHSIAGSFVPFDNREPGLVLINSSGTVYFWDSVFHGLSGAERVVRANLSMDAGEVVIQLYRCSPLSYIVTTSESLPFRLRLVSTSGHWSIVTSRFQNPASVIKRVASIFSTSVSPHDGGVVAAAVRASVDGHPRSVWLLLDSAIQLWNVAEEGWEQLLFDERQIIPMLAAGVLRFVNVDIEDHMQLDIELVNIAVLKSTDLLVLISHQTSKSSHEPRMRSLVKMHYSGEGLVVSQVQPLPLRSRRELGLTSPQSMHVLFDRFVVLHEGDALTMLSLNGKYSNVVPLRSGLDRFLALSGPDAEASLDVTHLLALTATGMMEMTLYLKAIAEGDDGAREEHLLLNTLKQAVLYGSMPHNPLRFLLPAHVGDEVLNQSVQDVSEQVLRSSFELLPTKSTLDMESHLKSRMERLQYLIEFISVNSALTRLRLGTLLSLEADIEKLAAAQKLWQWFNERALSSRGSLFVEAVHTFLEVDGENAQHGDVVRSFFREQLELLGELLCHIGQIIDSGGSRIDRERVIEAIDVALIILHEATGHRNQFQAKYRNQLETSSSVCIWTASPKIIDALQVLFNYGEHLLVAENASTPGDPFSAIGGEEHALPQKVGELAQFIFSCSRDRELWLSINAISEHDGNRASMKARQSKVLEALVSRGLADIAFGLAEDYGDFQNLAKLCYHPRSSSSDRVSQYIDQYGDVFTQELFKFFIENRIARNIFFQDERHADLVEQFFSENAYPRLSWMHDIHSQQWVDASTTLLEESTSEKLLGTRHVMLSIALLSKYASNSASVDSNTETFDLALDLISIQQVLWRGFHTVIEQSPSHQTNVESKVDLVIKGVFPSVQTRPSLLSLIKQNVRRIIQNHCLGPQDLIDTICLADEVFPGADFGIVVNLLRQTTVVPEPLREQGLRDAWRRLYLRDDWRTLSDPGDRTDNEVNAALRQTRLYGALRMLSQLKVPEPWISAQQSSITPPIEHLERRWPGHSPEQIRELMDEYAWESEEVLHNGVADVFEQVQRLEAKDREEERV